MPATTSYLGQTDDEPLRVSSATLLKFNISNPVLYLSVLISYLLSASVTKSSFWFLIVFALIFWLIDHHVESYKRFRLVRRCVEKLSKDKQALRVFLSTHLHHNFSLEYQLDTFRWANRLIASFWPYVSHVVHYELNNFIKTSKSFSKPSSSKMKRLLYAIGRQIDSNIMVIEHCQLGARAPFIKSIKVLIDYEDKCEDVDEDNSASQTRPGQLLKKSQPNLPDKLLVFDLDLAYEGNMNISFIYKYLCCCSSRLGLRDVFIRFRSRLALGPIQDNIMKFRKINFSLLELPEFGYKGIAIIELARLKVARRSINSLIKEHLLYPKSLSIQVDDLYAKPEEKDINNEEPQAEQANVNQNERPPELPACTRFFAKFLVFSCLCTSCCLKLWCCQCNRTDKGRDAVSTM